MKVLFLNPKYPDTYWSFKHALKFVSKRALNPPLGQLTVAAMLPDDWDKKLIDLNVSKVKDSDIKQADIVFIGGMSVQLESARQLVDRCKRLNTKTVAGGPLFTEQPELFADVDHLILNEAELTIKQFIYDLKHNKTKHTYETTEFADITQTPPPDYSLIDVSKYAMMGIQYTRGCPHDCEFCDITALFGRRVRTKNTSQIIKELDNLLQTGWNDNVFFVDDNFIGNKRLLKKELLPAIIQWMKTNNHPFTFTTEATVNLADDKELMQMMVDAGFTKVFIGIETPEEAGLVECNKKQNTHRDLLQCVKAIHAMGIEVTAGFIVGFDSDTPSIFQRQIDFIQKSGIISAMVGILNAPKKTKLYKRLQKEGRIVNEWTGDNTDYSLNFVPKMKKEDLLDGYQSIIHGIYSSKAYYKRIITFLKQYNPPIQKRVKLTTSSIIALLRSIWVIGILKKNRRYYWHLFFWSIFNKPELFPLAVTFSIYGYHYRKVFKNIV